MKKSYQHQVTLADTAIAMGSGEVAVLATPRLVAWMEAASMEAVKEYLEEGETTVGTEVRIEHSKGVPVGATVTVAVGKPVKDGRRLLFHLTAVDAEGNSVATGSVARAKVDIARFMAKCQGLSDATASLPIVKVGKNGPHPKDASTDHKPDSA